ncbi:MAG TPA: single-stranded DNA-binding protein [Sphingobacteriaceae bacterium]|nr:single-stranded DNA-binding protein [Sphingobacteriaceae bacterium]
MSALRNSVRLTGFLGNHPEVLLFDQDKKLAKVSLATHERFRNVEGEWKTETHWHNLLYWGKMANFAEQQLTKGAEISIEGKLLSRSYEDKDGQTRFTVEVVVNETLLLKPRKKSNSDKNDRKEDKSDQASDESKDE